jgi:hypothetical protein
MREMVLPSGICSFVMAGLDPAIHALKANAGSSGKGVDARNKSGHDGLGYIGRRSIRG